MELDSPAAAEPAEAVDAPALDAAKPRVGLNIVSLMVTLALAALDNNIVNTALPRMAITLGGLDRLPWVISAFMLSSTVTMPLYGKLSDIYGRRTLFTVAIGIFVGGSILCSVAQTMDQLIAFRCIQGAGAGGLIPLVMTAVGDIVTPRQRGMYQGFFSAVFAVCNLGGPVLGGILTDTLGWRSIFYVNVPIGAIALLMLRANLPVTERRAHAVDFLGAILVAMATVPFMGGLSRLAGDTTLPWLTPTLFVAAAGAALTLYLWERRFPEPVVAVNLFGDKVYRRCVLVTILIGLGFFGTIVFIPLYLQQARGLAPATSGLMITPLILANICSAILSGRYVSKTGSYKRCLVAGMGCVALGLGLLSVVLSHNASLWVMGVTLAMIGVGGGLGMPQLTMATQNTVKRSDLGAATSTLQFFNSLAGSSGVALSGSMLSFGVLAAASQKLGPGAKAMLHGGTAHLSPPIKAIITEAYGGAIGRACLLSAVICACAFVASIFVPDVMLKDK
jgi:EmrB/QacA subfamily drug resistance transporter